MQTTRRSLLKATTLSFSAAALAGCDRVITQVNREFFGEGLPSKLILPTSVEIDPEFHLLSRAAFGSWPGDVQRVKKMGREKWIEEQLNPGSISDTACDLRAEQFESLYFSAGRLHILTRDS